MHGCARDRRLTLTAQLEKHLRPPGAIPVCADICPAVLLPPLLKSPRILMRGGVSVSVGLNRLPRVSEHESFVLAQ